MRLHSLVNVLARRRGGLWFLGGVAAVLGTVERLMTVPKRPPAVTPDLIPMSPNDPAGVSVRSDFFTIKRTQSDLGLTFWVLQGHGVYASFELFDTWAEAIAAANTRLMLAGAPLPVLA